MGAVLQSRTDNFSVAVCAHISSSQAGQSVNNNANSEHFDDLKFILRTHSTRNTNLCDERVHSIMAISSSKRCFSVNVACCEQPAPVNHIASIALHLATFPQRKAVYLRLQLAPARCSLTSQRRLRASGHMSPCLQPVGNRPALVSLWLQG